MGLAVQYTKVLSRLCGCRWLVGVQMAEEAMQPAASRKMQDQYTAQQVIEMFRALNNLPVTDDAAAIEREVQRQQVQRLHERTYATDPGIQVKADAWFKQVQLLHRRRQELFEIVQAFFDQLANMALEGVFKAGIRELTPAVYASLRTIAQEQCHLDDRLVARFVDTYLAKRHLKVGAPLSSQSCWKPARRSQPSDASNC